MTIERHELIWIFIGMVFNFVPPIIIIFFPFRDRLRASGKKVVFICAVFILAGSAAFSFLPDRFMTFSFYQVWKYVFALLSVGLCLYYIDESKTKVLYFFIVLVTLSTAMIKTANFIGLRFFDEHGYIGLSVVHMVVHTAAAPPIMIYINKLVKKTVPAVELTGKKIWRVICLIPMLFLLVNINANPAFDPQVVVLPVFMVTNALSVVGILVSSEVLYRALYIAGEAYKAKRESDSLSRHNMLLDKLNRTKTEFLQDIKHEIRNPLHIISLGTDVIRNHTTAEEALAALDVVQNEAMRLGRVVNGMVGLATMNGNQAGREKLDFSAMLAKCAEASRLQMERKRITLRVEIAPDLPFVYAEAEQLERILVNILENAAKYAEYGEITVHAAAKEGYIHVKISDTGKGIPPELMPHVFERGVSESGEGYGLPICKTIAEAHGGEIFIESERGKGTSVTFTIPVYGGQSEVRGYE